MATSKRRLLERQYNIVGKLKALTWLLLATGVPYDKQVTKKFLIAKNKLIKVTEQLNATVKKSHESKKHNRRNTDSGSGR